MIGIGSRDLVYSVTLHVGLIMLVTMLQPFTVAMRRDFDAVAVNVITLPPLGDVKAKGQAAAAAAEAVKDKSVPIATPESKKTKKAADKSKQKAKPKPAAADTVPATTGIDSGVDISGQLGPGSAFGSVSVDNADFNYPTYFVVAFRKIEQNWSNPVAANQVLSCVIYFQILRSGSVLDPLIERSSGVEAYDRACLRALQASDPLPQLPPEFRDDIIGIHLEFPYQP